MQPEAAMRLRRDTVVSGRSAEAIIFEKSLVPDDKLAAIKSEILKVPYRQLDEATITESVLAMMSEETARTYAVVPLGENEGMFIAGMVNPDDLKAQEALKFIANQRRLNLGVFLISYGDWQKVLRKYSPFKDQIAQAVKSLNIKQGDNVRSVSLETGKESGEDAPIIRIVADMLKEAIQLGASDIHIEPMQNYLRARFRIDGELRESAQLPAQIAPLVVSRVKILSSLKIDETRVPQDGRFRTNVFDREVDFRVATFPTPLGEKVAIRILDSRTGLRTFQTLGLSGRNLELVQEGLAKPFGMILVTGPTGSGKSTTLYALLQQLNKEDVNIVSLEDPVEYFVAGINQSQVRPEIGYDFASGLRQILRQDPDVIMVGEIRDSETAGLAINAALTGHIVLSTLHTNNTAGVIPRLVDMKVEPFLLPSSLTLMLAQRLVSKICHVCKKQEEPATALQGIIEKTLSQLPEAMTSKYEKPYKVWRSPGCESCKGKGTEGRIAVMEVLVMTPELEAVISSGATLAKIQAEQKRQGMLTMRQDGILKVLDGLTTIEDVLKETEEV